MNRSRGILLVVLVVAFAAVLADQAGLFAGGGQAEVGTSARDDYLGARAEADRREAVLAQAEDVDGALEAAEESWEALRDTSISAQTRALAQSALRDRVIGALRSAGVNGPVVNERAPAEVFDETDTVQPIAVSIRFDASDPTQAYEALRTLESMPSLWTRIDRAQLSTTLTSSRESDVIVDANLSAIAIVRETEGS